MNDIELFEYQIGHLLHCCNWSTIEWNNSSKQVRSLIVTANFLCKATCYRGQ